MNISRNISTPVVIAVTVVTAIVAFISVSIGEEWYHRYSHVAAKQQFYLPAFSLRVGILLPCVWFMPAFASGAGAVLLLRQHRQVASLIWYCSAAFVLTAAWLATLLVATYFMYATCHHYF